MNLCIYSYIIIGGGISGITISNKLIKKDNNILLLESSNRLGGRIYSKKIKNNYIEFGAKWIHGNVNIPNNEKIKTIIEEYDHQMIQKFKIVDSNISNEKIKNILNKYMIADLDYNNEKYYDALKLSKYDKDIINIIFSENYGEHLSKIAPSNDNFTIFPGKDKRVINGYSNIINIDPKVKYYLDSKVINISINNGIFNIITHNKQIYNVKK